MSFTTQILTGMLLGILVGLFFGELAAPLSLGGDIFIGLLQMSVLPYIVVSLVVNIGQISWAESRGLIIAAIAVLAVLLGIGVVVLSVTPLAYPVAESASFFSYSLIQEAPGFDPVALYIPTNPFASLANNAVPASVLFSILLGVGLSGIPGKDGLLRGLDVLAEGLNRINKIVIKITPYGVFAIAAGTAATISLEEINRLQAYVVTYTLLVLVLTLIVLPMLVSAVTPIRMRDLLGVPKNTLITIFATAKIIVLMPQLIENISEIFRRNGIESDEIDSGARIVLPLAYPFPNLGTYVILMFVGFAAWYLGRPLDLSDQVTLQATSLMSSFVAPIVGIPFLLDVMRIPADVMELFVVSTVYTDRIRVVLGAMHLLSLTVVVLAIRHGVFRPDWRRLAIAVTVSILAIAATLMASRFYLARVAVDDFQGGSELVQMRWMERTVDAVSYRGSLPTPDPRAVDLGRLNAITDRGTLRVGYFADSLPWAFSNEQSEITGFDVEMAHHLAGDLSVSLEMVRIEFEQVNALFDTGQIDIVMSGLAMTPDRIRNLRFGASPLDLTLGFLVADHRRKEFADVDKIAATASLNLAIVQTDPAFQRQLASVFPAAQISTITSPREFMRGNRPEIDAVIYSAEGGSAWTLIYPSYSIVVPQPVLTFVPAGYPVPRSDDEWATYLSEWMNLRRKDGTVELLFDHWIRGKGTDAKEPRWSIVRDVLAWVD
jgi:Na+/H+-dicarboxylate symporter/ABC-type amino acid transport substrate-binding protein